MIPKECKRLAEVDFPIAEVSKHAAREKSIRHGHPSTLHLWWARRPLASSRAVLLALLWPDPCDPLCPPEFKAEAKKRLPQVPGCNPGKTDEDLRKSLLRFIADFANWDLAANPTYLEISRALVKAAYAAPAGGTYEAPLVVDPFAGGGSIPLEALRVGCEAFASDLNPVACLILKVMLEDIPRHGPKLADELRRVGAEIKREAEKELADLYPKDPDGATPIAYLWARTVRCESPNCGAEIPLVRSFWLCKKAKRRKALKPRINRPNEKTPSVEFEIFEPKSEKDVSDGAVSRAKATCLCCGNVLPPERVRAQLSAQRGGADVAFDSKGHRIGGARLLAVVTHRPGEIGRHYRLSTDRDYEAVRKAQARVEKLVADWERGGKQGFCPVPDEPLPLMSGTFNVPLYGINRWGDLFMARQHVALTTLVGKAISHRGSATDALAELVALVVDRVAVRCTANCVWDATTLCIMQIFNQGQALPFRSEWAEMAPLSEEGSGWDTSIDYARKVVEALSVITHSAVTQVADATEHPLPDAAGSVFFTDPPYYFAVPYADLSDFFFVWLKRSLADHPYIHDPFDPSNPLTHKVRELCEMSHWDSSRYAHKDQGFFENGIFKAFENGRRVLKDEGVGSVVFAHKTTEGWEALLSGMIRSGLCITASWPIWTESRNRLRAKESAALGTSVHLICRPRSDSASIGDWGEVLRELPKRVGDWMERLQTEGVRGADLVFACIGPALEIFSRYRKVETADGREVKLGEYLEKVWEVVGRSALEQVLGTAEAKARNGAAGALEEDARLTALFLWTMQSTVDVETTNDEDDEVDEESDENEGGKAKKKTKGFSLPFDVARRFAQPLGVDLAKWEGRIIETDKGVIRLFAVSERAKQLFGEEGAMAVAHQIERDPTQGLQQSLFPDLDEPTVKVRGRKKGRMSKPSAGEPDLKKDREATVLDRVHAAMLLQSSGQANALRALIKAEQDRGPDFLRLANALSALYPKDSEEKRLLDAMLLAVPR